MDKAKAAVSNFLSKDGKHDTTVHEKVHPAIENEQVHRHQKEEAQTAVDREIHQHHYHTSVQPITHKEVLPEQHSHQMMGVEHREHHHGNPDHVNQRLEAERAQFKNTRNVGDVQRTAVESPTVVGEHVHHHVHESIQPIIQKETIQPSVIHTTIPVHEVHHNEAKHHAISSLPAVTMDEFKTKGGVLTGRDERSDAFAGEPRAVGAALGTGGNHTLGGPGAAGTTSVTDGGSHHHNGLNGNTTSGLNGTNNIDQANGTSRSGMNSTNMNSSGMNSTGMSDTSGMNDTTDTTRTTKSGGLLNKLNPKTDSNGDGKVGFMK